MVMVNEKYIPNHMIISILEETLVIFTGTQRQMQ